MRRLNKNEIRFKHIQNLADIFGMSYEDTKVIFKDLKAIEHKGHGLAEDYCNGLIETDEIDVELFKIKEDLGALIPSSILKELYLNLDPRGYFLKIDDDYTRQNKLNIETDWGGYGIICPENI